MCRLFDQLYLVRGDIANFLHYAGRPSNFYQFCAFIVSQSKMDRPIAGRSVTHAGCHMVVLRAAPGHNLDASPDSVAVAARAFERDIQPVPCRLTSIHP